jgi:hypothetical protein
MLPYFELPDPDAPLEPVLGELPEGEVELLPEPVVLPEPAEPLEPLEPLDMPDDPVELLDLSKYCCHSERETWPSPFLSTDVKLGEEDEPEALLPPEAPLAPLLLEPPADEDGVDDEDGLEDDEEPPAEEDGVEEDDEDDGLVADEPLLDDLSPAPMAVPAKPTNAAVTAALMSFNVMDEVSCVDEGLQPRVLQTQCRMPGFFPEQIQRASDRARVMLRSRRGGNFRRR